MNTSQEPFYMRDSADAFSDVRDALNRQAGSDPDPARIAAQTGHPVWKVLEVWEALEVEDLGVC